ncbi:MAG TPA: calcium-binding protein [Stellaceae bacterium]|jgi:hypothetical protein|nr:calcium-binding protein [Stellaceae bacterium]
MSSVPGSFLVFGKPASDSRPINLVVTPNGAGATTVAGAFNIEVFTTLAGPVGAGFDASAFVSGATQNLPTEVQAGNILATEQLLTGSFEIIDVTGGETLMSGTGANQSIIGAAGDTLIGGTGAGLVLNALAGAETVVQGSGANNAVFGGAGATILASTAATTGSTGQIIGDSDNAITLNSAGSYTVASGVGDTITGNGSSAGALIAGAQGDLIDLTGDSGTNTLIGSTSGDTIIAGSGATFIAANTGDSIVGGNGGTEQISAVTNGAHFVVGSGGTETYNLGGGGNTVTALSGSANVNIGGGNGDSIDLTGNTGTEAITGAAGMTVTVGSGNSQVDGNVGGIQVALGTSGSSTITGSGSPSAGDTITGSGSGSLDFVLGSSVAGATVTGTDLINLSGSTGSAQINVFNNSPSVPSQRVDYQNVNATVMTGNGSTSVFGGGGDRIGAGTVGGAGSDIWDHSTTVAGATVGFGTFDSVAGDHNGTNATVTNFQTGTDFLFYQAESQQTNDAIVAASTPTTVGGQASTTLVLPDGTTMTLVGVTQQQVTDANTAHTLFK